MNTSYFKLGLGFCALLNCIYLFVMTAKICRREQISCLFQSTTELTPGYKALELKNSTRCKIWQFKNKVQIAVQDSNFIIKNFFRKESWKLVCQMFMFNPLWPSQTTPETNFAELTVSTILHSIKWNFQGLEHITRCTFWFPYFLSKPDFSPLNLRFVIPSIIELFLWNSIGLSKNETNYFYNFLFNTFDLLDTSSRLFVRS